MSGFTSRPVSLAVAVEWIAAVTFAAGTAVLGYLAYKKFYAKENRTKAMVNLQIQKDNPKVVHAFDMEDLGDKAVYCRCWRSKKVGAVPVWHFIHMAGREALFLLVESVPPWVSHPALCLFETKPCRVAQAGLELTIVLPLLGLPAHTSTHSFTYAWGLYLNCTAAVK